MRGVSHTRWVLHDVGGVADCDCGIANLIAAVLCLLYALNVANGMRAERYQRLVNHSFVLFGCGFILRKNRWPVAARVLPTDGTISYLVNSRWSLKREQPEGMVQSQASHFQKASEKETESERQLKEARQH